MAIRQIYSTLDSLWVRLQDSWTALRPARFSLLAVGITGITLILADQSQDVLIYIAEDIDWELNSNTALGLIKIVGGTSLFCLYIWYWTSRAVSFRFPREEGVMLSYRTRFPPAHLAADPYKIRRQFAKRRVIGIRKIRRWLPQVLTYVAALLICLSLLKASGAVEERTAQTLRFLMVVVLLLASCVRLFPKPQETYNEWNRHTRFDRILMMSCGAVLSLCVVSALIWPVWIGQFAGPVVVLLVSMFGLVAIFTPLAMWNRRRGFPIVAVIIAITILLNRAFDVHAIRLIDEDSVEADMISPSVARRPTVSEAATKWYETVAQREGGEIPLILVSTAGGGIRAAYWTATVLGFLQDSVPGFSNHLFAISGVSGGALGAAVFRAALTHADANPQRLEGKFEQSLQKVLEDDFLAPPLAAMLTRDLFPFLRLPDRAAALEEAWEHSWNRAFSNDDRFSKPFLALWPNNINRPWPAILLNGSVVATGERIVVSNLQLPQESMLALDALAYSGRDVRVSTAVNYSARFPYIGPAGVIESIKPRGVRFANLHVVDGGYFENNGAATTFELLDLVMKAIAAAYGEAAASRIKPYVIQITSDPALDPRMSDPKYRLSENAEGARAPELFYQALAPFRTMYNTRQAHALQTFKLLRSFVEESHEGKFIHISMCRAPNDLQEQGARSARLDQRPPLGWTLSKTARANIKHYLRDECNRPKFDDLVRLSHHSGWKLAELP
jgi:hypothetical protein